MRRIAILVITLFVVAGCSTKTTRVFHDLPIIKEQTDINQNTKITLGVNTINIPSYLDTNRVVYAQSDGNIKELRDLRWSAPFGTHMQNIIINQLQHSFPESTIREYPWGFYKQPLHILKVDIHSLSLYNNTLMLHASYSISSKHTYNKSLNLKRELTSMEDGAIMYQMMSLITQLIDTIAHDIN